MTSLRYLSPYSDQIQQQVQTLIDESRLTQYLVNKYPDQHKVRSDKALRDFVLDYKNRYVKKSQPLNKICFDPKIHVIKNALGTHTFVSRVQGNKLKSKNEIRISTLFRKTPNEFLQMIVVHELAHFKEKDHNKAFYQLCCHMLPNYPQLELDTRIYLTHLEVLGDPYKRQANA